MKKQLVRATLVAFCSGLCVSVAHADPAPVVNAQPTPGNGPQQWRPDTDGWDRIPDMPRLQDIPAIPFPTAGGNFGVGGGQPIGFNRLTGEEMLLPARPDSGEIGGGRNGALGADGRNDPELMPEGFGTMSIIADATRANAPWRMNAKMAMRWVNNNGGNSWFVASGSMIDSKSFLTAGHCVYSFGTAGIPNSWAADIYVFPGWDGAGNIFGPSGVYNQYGYGTMTHVWSWTGWTQSGNWDNDVALVGIDRAVGHLTGWYGTAWGFDCATIQGRTYNNAAYPAEGCGTAGLHNGADMTYWSGSVDACPNNQMQLFTTAGCYTAVWGGMSGSGMYYFPDANNRWIHGICSTSNRTTRGQYVKQWESWFNAMYNDLMPVVRGNAFDLQALQCRTTGATSIRAGEAGTGWSFFSSNPTNNNPASANYTYRVYLSSNTTISSGDTLLGTYNYNWDYGANGGVTVNMVNPTIPDTVPAGTYYIGVIFDGAVDGNSGNNDSSGWDCQQVTILPARPNNNACIDAIPVSAGTVLGTTVDSTMDGASDCGFPSGQGPDVWYSYTATCSGPVTFDTIGSNLLAGGITDTVLSLHTNSCPSNVGNQLACNDDGGGNLMSSITYNVVRGTTYKIRVCGYNGRIGTFQLNVTPLDVTNDTCLSAQNLVRNTLTNFSTCTATNSPPLNEPQCNFFGFQTFGQDVWFRWVADRTGTASVNTCDGTNYDTKIAAYASCPGSTSGQVISCNDDSCALQSRISFPCVAGQDYFIRVGGYTTAAGTGGIYLRATCKADYNQDDIVDLFDYLDFVADFAANASGADYNADTVVDFFDYLDFVADFAAGCN
jgi:hypothetical protein